MDAYDRCTNLEGKKILPILLPSKVEAKNFSDHPRMSHDVRKDFNEYLISNNFPSDLLCSVLYHYHYFAIFKINGNTLLWFWCFP